MWHGSYLYIHIFNLLTDVLEIEDITSSRIVFCPDRHHDNFTAANSKTIEEFVKSEAPRSVFDLAICFYLQRWEALQIDSMWHVSYVYIYIHIFNLLTDILEI